MNSDSMLGPFRAFTTDGSLKDLTRMSQNLDATKTLISFDFKT